MSSSPPLVVADRYRLVAPLGQGGMGRVWRATDVVLHRDVAIKELVPPPGLTPEERQEMRERSLREARAIARLNNVNVVRVFDVLRTDADPWIVMEYVPSRSLQDVLAADGPFNAIRAAEIGLGVLGALRAAHRAGVVHRDVKPGNVLMGEDGRVVLTDFGLATVPGDPNVTRTGLVLGSPAYIAPERARDGTAGPAADLWSLGATLYAAVEGASPFARPSAIATLAALATENPPPARNAGPLKPVLNGLLRKDPAHRINAEEAERLLLRATGRRSKLSFPMSPTMRRPGVGRERPSLPSGPGGPPVLPGATPSVPGPRPPIAGPTGPPPSGGRPPVYVPGKASVGPPPAETPKRPAETPKRPVETPTRVDGPKVDAPRLDATRVDTPAVRGDAPGGVDKTTKLSGTGESRPKGSPASGPSPAELTRTNRGELGAFTAADVAAHRRKQAAPEHEKSLAEATAVSYVVELPLTTETPSQRGGGNTASDQTALVQPSQAQSARTREAAARAQAALAASVQAAQAKAAQTESARQEAARREAAAKVEAARVEAARVEAIRVEAARVEAARVEAARVEAARVEAARVEAARVEAARVAAARQEAARAQEAEARAAAAKAAEERAARARAAEIKAAEERAAAAKAAEERAAAAKADEERAAAAKAAEERAAEAKAAEERAAAAKAAEERAAAAKADEERAAAAKAAEERAARARAVEKQAADEQAEADRAPQAREAEAQAAEAQEAGTDVAVARTDVAAMPAPTTSAAGSADAVETPATRPTQGEIADKASDRTPSDQTSGDGTADAPVVPAQPDELAETGKPDNDSAGDSVDTMSGNDSAAESKRPDGSEPTVVGEPAGQAKAAELSPVASPGVEAKAVEAPQVASPGVEAKAAEATQVALPAVEAKAAEATQVDSPVGQAEATKTAAAESAAESGPQPPAQPTGKPSSAARKKARLDKPKVTSAQDDKTKTLQGETLQGETLQDKTPQDKAPKDKALGDKAPQDKALGDKAPTAKAPTGKAPTGKARRGAVREGDQPSAASGNAARIGLPLAQPARTADSTRVVEPVGPVAEGAPSGGLAPLPGIKRSSRPAWKPMQAPARTGGITVLGTRLTYRQAGVGAGVLLLVVVLLIVLVAKAFGDDDQTTGKAGTPIKPTAQATTGTTPSTAPSSPAASATTPSSAPPSSAPPSSALPSSAAPVSSAPAAAVALPPGMSVYRDKTGFAVPMWTGASITRTGTEVYFRKNNRLLIVDQTDTPQADPLQDWKNQEADRSGRYRDYHKIKLVPVKYFQSSADWEFTYTTDGGNPQHAVKRNILVNDHQAYSLSWYTSPDDWNASQTELQAIYQGFSPKK